MPIRAFQTHAFPARHTRSKGRLRASAMLAVAFLSFLVNASTTSGQAKKFPSVAEQCKQVSQDTSATWRTIPWQTDLLAAQKLATEQEKPLFVWAMDGHPLGCT
jgi:hypothetical protein